MKTVVALPTVAAAFAKCQLFAAQACSIPELGVDRFDAVIETAHAFADEALAKHTEERVDSLEAHLPCPLLGYLETSDDGKTTPSKRVILLSGEVAAIAAAKLGAALPVYLLEPHGAEALIDAGLFVKGAIVDKAKAVATLNAMNLTIAAELLADTADPINHHP